MVSGSKHHIDKCPSCSGELSEGGACPSCLLGLASESEFAPVHAAGQGFGDYEILEELARGGMGVVYRARQRSLDRELVVKMIHGGVLAGKEKVERFHYEARAASKLTHSNIVPVHDIGEIDGRHFFTMDFYRRGTLADCLAEFQVTNERGQTGHGAQRVASRLVAKIARAVHFAHSHGVIHRDLKPSNILLGEDDEPFVGDFSLARLAEEESGLTVSGAVLGTPAYMAPEQAEGKVKELTIATDVYGLGAVLYELLTGHPPFIGESPTEILRKVSEEEVGRIRGQRPWIHVDLETICLRCLEKNPSQRYSSALEVAEELERFERREPIVARQIHAVERLLRWCQRRPLVASLGILLFLTTLIGATAFVLQRNQVVDSNVRLVASLVELDRRLLDSLLEQGKVEGALGILAKQLAANPGDRFARIRARSILETQSLSLPIQPTLQLGRKAVRAVLSPDRTQVAVVVSASAPRATEVGVNQRHPNPRMPGPSQSVLLWDLRRNVPLPWELAHEGQIHDVSFSSDGGQIVTASWDGTARIWDLADGQMIRMLEHEQPVWGARLSPDGERLVTTTCDTLESGRMLVWDTRNWQIVFDVESPRPNLRGVRFSPSGNLYANVRAGNSIRETITGKSIAQIPEHQDFLHEVAFSPDNQRLLTGAESGLSMVVDTGIGVRLFEPILHGGPVYAAQFSPSGLRFATGAADGVARVWDAETGEPVTPPLVHDAAVIGLEFSRLGQKLVTTSQDGSVAIWDSFSGRQLTRIRGVDGPPIAAFFGANQDTLFTVSETGACNGWDVRPGRAWPDLTEFGWVQGSRYIARSETRTFELRHDVPREIRLWSAAMTSFDPILDLHGAPMTGLVFSPSSNALITAATDGSIKVWEPDSLELIRTMRHDEAVTRIRSDATGQRLLTASDDGSVRLWRVSSGELIMAPLRHDSPVTDARFSRDRQYIASGCANGKAAVWEVETGRRIGTWIDHGAPVKLVAVLADNRSVLIVDESGQYRLWDVQTGWPLSEAQRVLGEPDRMMLAEEGSIVDLSAPIRVPTSTERSYRIELDVADVPASDSFVRLVHLLSQSSSQSVDQLAALRQAEVAGVVADEDAFVSWFLQDREQRSLSVGASTSVGAFLKLCLTERTRMGRTEPNRLLGAASPYVFEWRADDPRGYVNRIRYEANQAGAEQWTAYYLSRHAAWLSPGNPDLWYLRAELASRQGRYQEAIDACEQGLVLDPVRLPFVRLRNRAQRDLKKQTSRLSHVSRLSRESIEALLKDPERDLEQEPGIEVEYGDRIGIEVASAVEATVASHLDLASVRVPLPSITVPERGNHALSFDGWDDYVAIEDVQFGTRDFTIEAWIRPVRPRAGFYQYLFSNRTKDTDVAGNWFMFAVRPDGRLGIYFGEGQVGKVANLAGESEITTEWNHVAVVREGEVVRFFVNGELDGVHRLTPIRDLNVGKGARIGGWPDMSRCFFEGAIDEIRVWTRARAQGAIWSGMRGSLTEGEKPGLIAHYSFDQGLAAGANTSVTLLSDGSEAENHGELRLFGLGGRGQEASLSNWVAGAPALGGAIILSNDHTGSADASGEYPLGNTVVTWTLTDGSGGTTRAVTEVRVDTLATE